MNNDREVGSDNDGPNPQPNLQVPFEPPITPLPGKFDEAIWAAIVAFVPLVIDILIRGVLSNWKVNPVEVSNLSFCLFALSLAAFIRITSHGNGRPFLPILLLFAITEIVFALTFSGSFTLAAGQTSDRLMELQATLGLSTETSSIMPTALSSARQQLQAINNNIVHPNLSVYIILSIIGVLSLLTLFRYWAPAFPEGARKRKHGA